MSHVVRFFLIIAPSKFVPIVWQWRLGALEP